MPLPPPEPNVEKPETLPTDINDQDRSTQGGPPGWIAFTILAGVFVIGALVLIFVFGFGGAGEAP